MSGTDTNARRTLIGIDLGTTNSAVAYVRPGETRVRLFEVPQLIGPAQVAPRRQLPSFLYLAGEHDLAVHETILPWRPGDGAGRVVVGELARGQGARMPSRMIASAKSWLCHPGVDRHGAILPWGINDGPKRSPVGAQAAYLAHIREAWNHAHPETPLEEQDVIITVPASFDEAARDLTLNAATAAGYPPVGLLEEPQAAFYAWLDARKGATGLRPGQRVLVFDVGGGTTDFTLITVDDDGDGFSRTAVGDHLLLGGDNVDLTIAKRVEARLTERTGKPLDALQWHGLVHACRLAKEQLLSPEAPEVAPIVVASRGSKLIAGTLRDEISRAEVEAILDDGFFPVVEAKAQPARGRSGLQEFGLPYAADAAITRHLASFLARHGAGHVDAILFNGGAMTPPRVRQRVLDQLAHWQGTPPRALDVVLPEMAVAQGAAYFGLVRRGQAARIKGGTARTYYVGAMDQTSNRLAVCLAAKGLEDGGRARLAQDFELITNRPVSFRLYSSSTRSDLPGATVAVGDGKADSSEDGSDLIELPPIVAVLRARGRSRVVVRLEVHITDLGALEIHCAENDPPEGALETRWKLAFDLRSAAGHEPEQVAAPHANIEAASGAIQAAMRGGTDALTALNKLLEQQLEARRDDWSVSTARKLCDALLEVAAERKRSADHEQRWLTLAGFCLRPGAGAPLDAWRVRQAWGVFNEGLAFPKHEPNRLAWWVVWRRVAGGMTRGQQDQIFDRLQVALLPNAKQAKKLAELKPSKQEVAEMWRTVGTLEKIAVGHKLKLADELMHRLEQRKGREEAAHLWALSRLAARVPLQGPLDAVVPPRAVEGWIPLLVEWDWPEPERAAFALAQIGRRTGDRVRDLDDATRARLARFLRLLPGGDRAAVLVEEIVELEAREERVALGDTLPAGLRLLAGGGSDDEPSS